MVGTGDELVETEVPYLFANGVRLGRVVVENSETGEPRLESSSRQHVFFELGDHLGSTSVVLDKATSELVEKATFQGYGAKESDYRPARWQGFREDYGFTGKEEDVEVGLQYFGKRFLSPYLGRWVSADPLGVHAYGGDLNLYAYVSGAVLKNIDPLGLQSCDQSGSGGCGGTTHQGEGGTEGGPGSDQQKRSDAFESGLEAGRHNLEVDIQAEERRRNAILGHIATENKAGQSLGREHLERELEEIERWREANRAQEPGSGRAREGYEHGYVTEPAMKEALENAGALLGRGKGRAGPGPARAVPKAVPKAAPAKVPAAGGGTAGGERAGKTFTPKGRAEIDTENAARHGGANVCENCGSAVVPGQKSQKGVSPPRNERQRDHIIPKSQGGNGDPSNGQVLCRGCNLEKSDRLP
jgi:RHS repeat-associated protein